MARLMGRNTSIPGNCEPFTASDTPKGINPHNTFYSHPTSGSLIRPEKIPKFENVHDAVASRYIEVSDKAIDENLIKEAQKLSHAALFEFVGLDNVQRKLWLEHSKMLTKVHDYRFYLSLRQNAAIGIF